MNDPKFRVGLAAAGIAATSHPMFRAVMEEAAEHERVLVSAAVVLNVPPTRVAELFNASPYTTAKGFYQAIVAGNYRIRP